MRACDVRNALHTKKKFFSVSCACNASYVYLERSPPFHASGEDEQQARGDDSGEKAPSTASTLPRKSRRVSFADEMGCSDSGYAAAVDEKPKKQSLSSLIDGEYHENGSNVAGRRRSSDGARARQRESAIIRAAHELLFSDTRPDGLRPVTGAPMGDGVDIVAGGGLFVGIAGLRAFDLSFSSAPHNSNTPKTYVGTLLSEVDGGDMTTRIRAADSPGPGGPEQLEQVCLLDRAPGSLVPGTPTCAKTTVASSPGGSTEDENSTSHTRLEPTPLSPEAIQTPPPPERSEQSPTATTRPAKRGLDAFQGTDVQRSDTLTRRGSSAPKPAILWSTSALSLAEIVGTAAASVGHGVIMFFALIFFTPGLGRITTSTC